LNLEDQIKEIIVQRLTLSVSPADLKSDAPLFGPDGLDLDSLSSLEILAGLADKFDLPLDDIEAGDFESVATLADYLRRHDAVAIA
jgi:acyl carrier protein